MEIFLEPFSLPDDEAGEAESELVDSSIRLDLSDLQDKVFTFPIKPEQGYIDGSIYFLGAHHPLDITQIAFGKLHEGYLSVDLKVEWNLEFESSGYQNTSSEVKTLLRLRQQEG